MRSMLHANSELCGFLLKNYTSMIMITFLNIKEQFNKIYNDSFVAFYTCKYAFKIRFN